MSRIGKKPISVPQGVKVALDGATVRAEGPKGKLSLGAAAVGLALARAKSKMAILTFVRTAILLKILRSKIDAAN